MTFQINQYKENKGIGTKCVVYQKCTLMRFSMRFVWHKQWIGQSWHKGRLYKQLGFLATSQVT